MVLQISVLLYASFYLQRCTNLFSYLDLSYSWKEHGHYLLSVFVKRIKSEIATKLDFTLSCTCFDFNLTSF